MGKYLLFNGRLLEGNPPLIPASNRGLRYGDGVFETMKLINGEIRLASLHFDRLFRGLALLQFEIPSFFTPESIKADILALCRKNKSLEGARIRLAVIRGNGGLYDPESHFPNYFIQSWPLPPHSLEMNDYGLEIDTYTLARKSCDVFAGLKTSNYLPSVMAALHARSRQLDDCFLLNTHDRICDTTIANVWWVHADRLYTPPLSEGPVAGVMREYLLQAIQAPGSGFTVEEKMLLPEELEQAGEIFLTNAISGIRWVGNYRGKEYDCTASRALFDQYVRPLNH